MRTIDHLTGVGTPTVDPYTVRKREAVYRAVAARVLSAGARRVCDLGCGDGYGAAILSGAGMEVTAVDDDPALIAAADRMWRTGRIRFRTADPRDTREPQRTYDAVVCTWTLEHLHEPRPLLAEARRLVGPGGTVVLCTPNRLVTAPGRTRPLDPSHAWEYTPDELRHLVRWVFEDGEVAGVFHRRRLAAIERVLAEPLPVALGRISPADRAGWLRLALWGLRASDFQVGDGPVREAVDLVAVAHA